MMEQRDEDNGHDADAFRRETGDWFYHGIITRLSRGNERGVVRSANGREIPFILSYVVLLGASAADLYEGMRVGFDLSWTSRGLRVTKIKVYS